jgi:hypothetical protein
MNHARKSQRCPGHLDPSRSRRNDDGARAVGIINDYVVSFFGQHVKGQNSALLGGPPTDYPEIVFESHNP